MCHVERRFISKDAPSLSKGCRQKIGTILTSEQNQEILKRYDIRVVQYMAGH